MSGNQESNPKFYPNESIQFVFGDLFQVNSKLESYELTNISRIVNVLGGQYTEVLQEHEEITEEDNYSEFEKETNEEQSTTTSTTESMETFANKNQKKENAFSVSTEVSGTYGVIKAQVDASYDNKNSSGSSQGVAESYAKSVVETSRKSVRTRVLTQSRKNTQIRDLETKKMGLDNRGGSNYVGIYRHISEVHKAELIKHQKHLFAKIYIPTPSESYSKHISGALTASTDSPAGLEFSYGNNLPKGETDKKKAHPLTFENLTAEMPDKKSWIDENWIKLASEFGVEEPIPFPSELVETKLTSKDFPTGENISRGSPTKTIKFSVPEGYYPSSYNSTATPIGPDSGSKKNISFNLNFPNGLKVYKKDGSGEIKGNLKFDDNDSFQSGGNFEVGFYYGTMFAFHLNLAITYTANKTTKDKWRLDFYNQILEAAEGKPTPEDKLGLSRRVNVLANADVAKKLIKEELEREAIQYVLGTDLKGFDAYWRDLALDTPEDNYPAINMDKTNSLQPIVSFLSTAFDFEKMSYRFLPAYLGAEDNRTKLFDGKNTGEIREFIQASWAEIILPIRRGEEYKLFYMLETGQVWSSSDDDAPLPNKREYLALSEEIEEDRALTTGKEVEPNIVKDWTFNLPTAFEILQEGGNLNGSPTASSNSELIAKPE